MNKSRRDKTITTARILPNVLGIKYRNGDSPANIIVTNAWKHTILVLVTDV
jgi:hypothetical protein